MKSHISASGIKKHRTCPKKWWFRYVSDREPVVVETKYLDLGSAVHEAIEQTLRIGMDSPSPKDWALDAFAAKATEHNVPEDMMELGADCVTRAIDYVLERGPETVVGVEESVEFEIDRPDVSETVLAKMDVTTENELWDWKTGSIRDDTGDEEKIQGAVYMAGYRVKYGHPPDKIRFVYLKEEKVRSFEPSDDAWNFMLSYARALSVDKRNGTFEPTPGEHCYWCDYEQFCPAAGGIGMDFDWERWTAL